MIKCQANGTNICSSLVHRSYSNNCPVYTQGSSSDHASDFAYISKRSPAFVDKTYVIEDIIETRRMILTAPPHFGKSLNISMLKYFFEIEVNKETAEPITQFNICKDPVKDTYNYKLFENLAVHRLHPEIMENWFGRHPVIHMDFSLKTSINSYQDAVNHCRNVVRETFKQHSYLLNSTKCKFYNDDDSFMRKYCDDVEFQKIQESNKIGWSADFSLLILYLFEHFGRKCIFLVDEYDAIFRASLANTDEDTFNSCRRLYTSLIDDTILCFNNRENVEAVVLSGISPMAIVGRSHSDRLQKCEFLQFDILYRLHRQLRKKLFDFHGFTRQEFDFLMDKHNIPADMRQQATEYYGGYCSMANIDEKFYNPYSIARFLQTKIIQGYWSNLEFFEKYQFLLNSEYTDLNIKSLIFEQVVIITPKRNFCIHRLYNKFPEQPDYLMECLYEQGYLQIFGGYGSRYFGNLRLEVKVANKEIKMILIEELKKYYRTCGKFDWDSMKACAELFDDIDFGNCNRDLCKIYPLLEKYCNGYFKMNEENIEVGRYESESQVIEEHLRRLLYNVASLTKYKTTMFNDLNTMKMNIEVPPFAPDLKMRSNHGCIMIKAECDTTAQKVLNQLIQWIQHIGGDETVKYVLIGLNLSGDKHLSMSAKIGNDFFTYGSDNRICKIEKSMEIEFYIE